MKLFIYSRFNVLLFSPVLELYKFSYANRFPSLFKEPEIRGISPNSGPRSGGTTLTLYGSNFDAGTNLSAVIGHTDNWSIGYTCQDVTR